MKKLHEWAKAHPDCWWQINFDCFGTYWVWLRVLDRRVRGQGRTQQAAINAALLEWEKLG